MNMNVNLCGLYKEIKLRAEFWICEAYIEDLFNQGLSNLISIIPWMVEFC